MRVLLVFCFVLLTAGESNAQLVSEADSTFIFKRFLSYDNKANRFSDINEPFIETYWLEQTEKARFYFEKAAYLNTIPINQRVILISYLDDKPKMAAHRWVNQRLSSAAQKKEYYRVLNTGYGVPYSKLGISEEEVQQYCSHC